MPTNEFFTLSKIEPQVASFLREAAEARFDFFNAVFLDTILQDWHKKAFEFQMGNPRTVVLAPRGSWKCVSPDSILTTENGLSYFRELLPSVENTLPYTNSINVNLASCLGTTTATQLFCGGVENRVIVETVDGHILKCAPEHQWLIWDSYQLKFREAGQLHPSQRILFRCDWQSFAPHDINPFNVPPEIWFPALAFFYISYPDKWSNVWRKPTFRKNIMIPLWKFFGSRNWIEIPAQLKEFLDDFGFDRQQAEIPNPLLKISKESARFVAKAFWDLCWQSKDFKPSIDHAIEIQRWFLNIGFPTKRVGSSLTQPSKILRYNQKRYFKGEPNKLEFTENQIAEFADLIAVEINSNPWVPQIYKIRYEKLLSTDFSKHPKKAKKFVEATLEYAPKLQQFKFLFCFPFFLQEVKSVTPDKGVVADLTTREGNYLVNGAVGHNSTVLGQHYSIWRALKDPEIRIGIVSKSSLLASSFVSKIKHIWETNIKMQMIWPDLIVPDKAQKWNTSEITLMRKKPQAEATITALGVGTALAGRHFDILIFDDVVDVESQNSPVLRKKIWDWFRFVAMPTLSVSRETQAHTIGTAYHKDDLYHKLAELEQAKGQWRVFVQPAILQDGTSFWEDLFPLEKLQQLESMYGLDVFKLQYQNDMEYSGGSGLIEWDDFDLNYYEPHEIEIKNLDLVMGVDLAAPGVDKTAQHSSFAIVVVGINRETQKLYVLDFIKRKNLRLVDQRDLVKGFYQRYDHISTILIEAFAVQSYFHEYLEECDIFLPVEKVTTSGSKESRFEFELHLIKNQRLLFKRTIQNEVIEELISFPNTTADLIDALYIAVKGLNRQPKIRFVDLW